MTQAGIRPYYHGTIGVNNIHVDKGFDQLLTTTNTCVTYDASDTANTLTYNAARLQSDIKNLK